MANTVRKEIIIAGAGLAGLIASVDLAENGFDVTVLESAKSAGEGHYNPSLHSTPADLDMLCNFTGIDLRQYFQPVKIFRSYFCGRCYNLKPEGFFIIERGPGELSVDTYLYNIAVKLGVKFCFGSTIKDYREIPPYSIVATGLSSGLYESLGIPMSFFYGAILRFNSTRSHELVSVFDNSIGDYYYHCALNGKLFGHLFQRKPLQKHTIEYCLDYLAKYEEFPDCKTQDTVNIMPGWSLHGPRLIIKDRILAGTISGMIDPLMGFGITGAVISGKIAAMAVYNRQNAILAFKKYTKNWRSNFILRKFLNVFPGNAGLQEKLLIKAPLPVKRFFLQSGRLAIPGIEKFPIMEEIGQK